MNGKTIGIKRKLNAFLLFYKQIFYFSVMIIIALSSMAFTYSSLDPGVEIDFTVFFSFLQSFSMALPTYIFIGSLGLTHYVQNNQYCYYRNQGCTIRSLILVSWFFNCCLLLFISVLRHIAGFYV